MSETKLAIDLPEIESFMPALDRITATIKTAEERLIKSGCGFPAEHGFLSWRRNELSQGFRIHRGERPLMETKIADRVEALKDIPPLMKAAEAAARAILGSGEKKKPDVRAVEGKARVLVRKRKEGTP